jgi:hypothetical protein
MHWTHTATLPGEVAGQQVLKEYRWRVEPWDGGTRVVAEHRQLSNLQWRPGRSPDRLLQLHGMTGVV